ncbi:hypothetical protein [Segetibacter koreensis]|uniref:hypothetical protein n=1 Tax=Segetibacter koreensis TaxID=398037 RepID=UPI000373E4DE|nr:hypothetical protein [Segetibacter koreensis]
MKLYPSKSVIFFVVLFNFLFISLVSAQSVKGLWYGVGQVSKYGDNNNYLSELKLKQTGKKVTGEFNYFFRRSEIKSKISGTYDAKTRTLFLNTSPVLNFQAKNENGADCPMKGVFTLKVSRIESTLSGQFVASSDYKLTCPDITVKFTKGINEQPLPTDTTPEVEIVTVPPAAPKKQIDPNEKLVAALNSRAFDASPVIDVDADSLKVTLYDNGEVDNDTISLFYNRKLVAAKKMLSDQPLTFMLPVDTTVNEIAMYAENLGKLPPNTALAVIYAGDKRYELGMTSTFIKNATIRFRRKQKTSDPKNIN